MDNSVDWEINKHRRVRGLVKKARMRKKNLMDPKVYINAEVQKADSFTPAVHSKPVT